MSNKTKSPARGTIGAEIAKLVKRYGSYSSGLYILEEAAAQAHQAKRINFVIEDKGGDVNVTAGETPGYKAVHQKEEACLARLRAEGVIV